MKAGTLVRINNRTDPDEPFNGMVGVVTKEKGDGDNVVLIGYDVEYAAPQEDVLTEICFHDDELEEA